MRVLVVDDSSFMRRILKRYILVAGHEVVAEATDGLEAIRKYKNLKPDVVTMDITMRNMDGLEAVKELKRLDPKAKIIMCTAMGQQYLLLEALEAGAIDFIVKPFTKSQITEVLEKAMH